jgi:hypothetical protein
MRGARSRSMATTRRRRTPASHTCVDELIGERAAAFLLSHRALAPHAEKTATPSPGARRRCEAGVKKEAAAFHIAAATHTAVIRDDRGSSGALGWVGWGGGGEETAARCALPSGGAS